MRSQPLIYGASAVFLLSPAIVEAKHGAHGAHNALEALHRRHRQHRQNETRFRNNTVKERGSLTCDFPMDAGLVAVTPGLLNGGWAIAPDQTCVLGRHCPYACPPGQVSMQWDPLSTDYSFPGSRNGGLFCGLDGKLVKPFPDRPYCQPTAQNIGVLNTCGSVVSFCQTVLPGDEDMLIPTAVNDFANLAVPDTTYWAATAAHYYINPPGVAAVDACAWGTGSKPVGNWSPYVAGANSDSSGQTYIKLGWNPIYLEASTTFRNEIPDWGVKIDCPNGGCNGLPCAIDPGQNKVNEMTGTADAGAGSAEFCVVTVQKGAQANFVVFRHGDGSNKAGQFYQSTATTSLATLTSSSSTTPTTAVSATTSGVVSTTTAKTGVDTASVTTTTTSKSSTGGYYQLFNPSTPSATVSINHGQTPDPSTSTSKHNGASSASCVSLFVALLPIGLSLCAKTF